MNINDANETAERMIVQDSIRQAHFDSFQQEIMGRNHNRGPVTYYSIPSQTSTCAFDSDWPVAYEGPTYARVNPRVLTPGMCCDYCGRRYKGDEYECEGCGAPT